MIKKLLVPALFLAVLVTPFLLRRALSTPGVKTRSTAPEGSALPLVIVTPHVEGIKREFADAFSIWHQQKYHHPVQIDYRSYGGTTDIVKYLDSAKPGFDALKTYGIDLVWGGGDDFFNKMKAKGHLDGVDFGPDYLRSVYPKPVLGGLPLYDTGTPPQWFGTALSSFGIGFNRDVVKYIGTGDPKTWRDLTDPRWRGWIVMADPTRSSSAVAVYRTIVERSMQDAADAGRSEDDGWADGMGLVRQIAGNARLFTDASSSLPGWVSSGDVGAAMTIDFHSLAQIDAVGSARMGFVEPAHATAINPDPIAMLKGPPDRETARHFIEFVLSPEGQKIWFAKPGTPGGPVSTALFRLPVRADAFTSDPTLKAIGDPFTSDTGFNLKASRKDAFDILPELIQVSCMDPLDQLREARVAIAKAGRGDLDKRLGKFPFGASEAKARAKILATLKDRPAVRMATLRDWSDAFRAEYRHLKQDAETGSK